MTRSSKSAEVVSWISLGLSLVLFGIAFFLGRSNGQVAVAAISWQFLSAAMIWFVLALQFHLRSMAEQERLDMTELSHAGGDSTLFHPGGEKAELLAVAQRRLETYEKWCLPGFSLLIGTFQMIMAWQVSRIVMAAAEVTPKEPLITAVLMTAAAFASFLMSRYATGMSAEPAWRPLRAGSSALLALSVLCFALAVGLAWALFQQSVIVDVMAWVVLILLGVLGIETVLNVVFDIYRPRIKGRYNKAAFDSRIIGIVNGPGGFFQGAASAMDYQFGFKVSQTWFYLLLEKAMVPLILFGALTLYLCSCLVIVETGEEGVLEHFGRPVLVQGEPVRLKPGLSLKWPWPIDRAYVYATERVRALYVGYVPKINPETLEPERGELLWGTAHHEEEFSVLVASGTVEDEDHEGALPVSLVKANMPVHYKIRDLHDYVYSHADPDAALEVICYQELAKFAASATIDVGQQQGESLLGAGRARAKRVLKDNVQRAADEQSLGVEIVFLGLQGIHPPPDVAKDYQAVVGAVQQKQALILEAQTVRILSLTTLAGSVEEAHALYRLLKAYQAARGQAEKQAELEARLDAAMMQAKGDIFRILREAQAAAFEKVTLARATGQRFAGQVQAYQAAPEIYTSYLRLQALAEVLPEVRKYVIVDDPNASRVTIIDLQEKLMPDLYDLGAIEETNSP
ncbi:MAG: hypothetical protein IIC50_03130 [Planctomycetes bacterium]|nr:hypothetical protein [Planctomycetota bacterium]